MCAPRGSKVDGGNYINHFAHLVIEMLFHQPYTKTQTVVDAGLAERKTAAVYLRELEKAGILRSKKWGKEVLFLNVRLLQLLSK